jgi:TM2 domain-containing membrane protein YozV
MNHTLQSGEKKLTLLLLCWIFGLLAIHRFYTGKYLMASLQLIALALAILIAVSKTRSPLVLLIPLPFLWLVIDTLLIIMGKFTDKEGKPIVDWV